MSSGIVKRARGRPPKSESLKRQLEIENENPEQNVEEDDGKLVEKKPTIVRTSGSMSLRPNKRVRIHKGELISEDSDELGWIEDSEDEYKDIESELESDHELKPEIIYDKSDDPVQTVALDEFQLQELSNRDTVGVEVPKRMRKKIMYNPKLAAQKRRNHLLNMSNIERENLEKQEKSDIMKTKYSENKDWICVGCCVEISETKLERCVDLFQGLTKRGNSLKDLLTSIIKESLDDSMVGKRLCFSCQDALNHIEDLYTSFRSAMDHFLDKYLLGQKTLEADLAGFDEIGDLAEISGSMDLNLSDIVIKVFDNPTETGFNALLFGHQDFGMTPLRMYTGSVVDDASLPVPDPGKSCHKIA